MTKAPSLMILTRGAVPAPLTPEAPRSARRSLAVARSSPNSARALASALVFGLAALLLSAGTVRAETTVAVLGVEPIKAPAQVAARFSASLKEHVTRTPGFKLVTGKALDEVKLVFGCVSESPVCMSKVGRSLQAGKLVWGSLKKSRRGYTLRLKLLDVGSARIEKKVKKPISKEEAATPSAAISMLVMRLLGAKIGAIKISSNVVGAEVLLGTRMMGTTDQSALVLRNVPEGMHVVQVRKDGYRTWVNRVQVSAGEITDVTAQLDLVETKPPVGTEPKRSSNIGWQVAFYVGVAATVGAAVGLIVNGMKVLSLEKDKTAILEELEAALPTETGDKATQIGLMLQTDGGCRVAAAAGNADKYPDDFGKINDICNDGDTRATVQNVLIGVTAGMAALTGFFAYKAFISSSGEKESKAPSKTRWTVAPSITPQGGGVGFSLQF